jgi:adenylosuccinate lyase
MERELWLVVMRAQAAAGVPISENALADYAEALDDIADNDAELEQIRLIETKTGHDLYARLLYFNRAAGRECAHLGLTSADVTENVQQGQIYTAAQLLSRHVEQVVIRLAQLARAEAMRPIVARTHGQPAQVTTLGKRVLDWARPWSARWREPTPGVWSGLSAPAPTWPRCCTSTGPTRTPTGPCRAPGCWMRAFPCSGSTTCHWSR